MYLIYEIQPYKHPCRNERGSKSVIFYWWKNVCSSNPFLLLTMQKGKDSDQSKHHGQRLEDCIRAVYNWLIGGVNSDSRLPTRETVLFIQPAHCINFFCGRFELLAAATAGLRSRTFVLKVFALHAERWDGATQRTGLLQALLLKEMSAHPAEETVYERRWGGTKHTHRKELHRQAAEGDPPPPPSLL